VKGALITMGGQTVHPAIAQLEQKGG
jgi:hypothetical protein